MAYRRLINLVIVVVLVLVLALILLGVVDQGM
jgi:hypothetical protein